MNSLLSITSESRTAYITGKGRVQSPLIMVGAASNEMPQDESLDALADRFVIKFRVDRIKKDENWKKFITDDYDMNKEISTKFTPEEIDLVYWYCKSNVEFKEGDVW